MAGKNNNNGTSDTNLHIKFSPILIYGTKGLLLGSNKPWCLYMCPIANARCWVVTSGTCIISLPIVVRLCVTVCVFRRRRVGKWSGRQTIFDVVTSRHVTYKLAVERSARRRSCSVYNWAPISRQDLESRCHQWSVYSLSALYSNVFVVSSHFAARCYA